MTLNFKSRILSIVAIALTSLDAAIGLVSTKTSVVLCYFPT